MLSPKTHISFIGSGNVANQLANALKQRGFIIDTIFARNKKTGSALAKKVKANFSTDVSLVKDNGGIVLIAVNDDSIANVVEQLPLLKSTLVLHTSGATDINVLTTKFKNCGVIWQVQTIQARSKVDFKKVPLVIEAINAKSLNTLKDFSYSISDLVYPLNSEQRRVLHLGAVFVNNFPNHLYLLAQELLQKHNMSFDIYAPLILSTTKNGLVNPKEAQTGPAKRNDKKSMQNHLQLLEDKKLKDIYKLLSESITNTYKTK